MSEKKESTLAEKKVSRRSMLKWTGALAAAAAVGAVAGYGATELMKPPPTPPPSFKPPLSPEVQARRDTIVQDLINRHADETTTYFTIYSGRMGGYFNDIPLKVHIKDGVVTTQEADDSVNPNVAREDDDWDAITKGRVQVRPRAINSAYRKMIYDPSRLLYPMKRVGPRGDPNGQFVRISWDEALDIVATNMKQAVDKYGPYSIYACDYSFNQWGNVNWINAGVAHWGVFSFPGHEFASMQALGTEVYGSTTQMNTLFGTKLVVGWGWSPSDAQDNNPQVQVYYATLAREKGVPFITISPRYTLSDEVHSDQWIPIRPGTDAAMAIAVANVLIKENLYDKAVVDKFVYGFDKWKDYIMGVTDGVEKTPEWAEPLTGVPAETIKEFTRLYAKSKPCCLIVNWGACRATLTENLAWAGIILQAMTGNIGQAGAWTAAGRGMSNGPDGGKSLPIPGVSPYVPNKAYASPALLHSQKDADAILLREKLDKGEITKDEYHEVIGNARDNPSPNIRVQQLAMYSLNALPGLSKRVEAFKKIDLVFVHTTRPDEPSARVSDVIFPRAENMEDDPLFIPNFNGFVYDDKFLAPPGECKSRDWLWVQVAKRLGVVDKAYPKYSQYGDEKWDQMWQDMAKASYEQWAASGPIKPLNPPSWDDFKKKPIFRWEMDATPPVQLHDEIVNGKPFPTESGKINAYSDYLAKGEDFLKTTKYGGYIDPYPSYHPEQQFGMYYDLAANDRPLTVITSHPKFRKHSWHFRNPWVTDELYEHTVRMSVPDAKARGIKDGDMVRVRSDVGETIVKASVTSLVVPGCCVMPYGQWWQPDAYTGVDHGGITQVVLTDRICPAKTYPSSNRVEVVRV
jgi:anaerobic dimethyl sulfoxide reductase subunit A